MVKMAQRIQNKFLKYSLRPLVAILAIGVTVVVFEIVCGVLISHEVTYPYPLPPVTQKERALLPYEIAVDHKWIGAKFPISSTIHYPKPTPPNTHSITDYVGLDDGHYRIKKDYIGRSSSRFNRGKETFLVYDVQVTIDKFGRRLSRAARSELNSDRHLVLMGCSYTFGDGINDDETLAWQINQIQSTFEAYNNGVGGTGPNDALWRVTHGGMLDGLHSKKGVAVYTFIESQMPRATYSTFNSPWGQALSAFKNENGKLIYIGNFTNARPWATVIYNYLAETNTFRFFRLRWPPLFNSDYDYVAHLASQLRDEYLRQTSPANHFVFVIYPEHLYMIDGKKLRAALSHRQVPFIDYSSYNTAEHSEVPTRIDYNGHPNKVSQAIYARWLLHDLENYLGHKKL